MSERDWTISWAGSSWRVTTFRDRQSALEHVEKHFFSIRESWEELDARARGLRVKFAAAAPAEREGTLEEGCSRYVDIVRQGTGAGQILVARRGPHDGRMRIKVASQKGIFAAFEDRTSDLVTAFRPYPPVSRGSLTLRQFQENARRKVEGM